METTEKLIEPLLKKVEAYGKTTCELIKMKAIDKSSTHLAEFISRVIFAGMLLLFIIMGGVAFSLWIGEQLGKMYLGFTIVAGIYGFTALMLFVLHVNMQFKIKQIIIAKALK